ncbi:hypothetical protein TDB9533_04154 [Thalassocella blandensis]|nr:hypothetical protein TDB9533_04154 [Thalassocella blandensis]
MQLKKKIPPVILLLIHIVFVIILTRLPGPKLPSLLGDFLSVLTLAVALIFALLALIKFKTEKTTVNPLQPEQATKLVTSGIYARSRNPMYLAMLCYLLCVIFWRNSIMALIAVPSFVLLMNKLQIEAEELALTDLFGQQYREYCDRVRRWI